LTSDAKIKANRANARASTGPKTAQGRVRAARNAHRHGLSLPLYGDPILSEEVEALACEIAGADANSKMRQHARSIAEALIDLRRVRHARHQFLTDKLNDEYYESRANRREKIAFIFELLRPKAPNIPMPVLSKYFTSTPQGPEKLATILSQEAKHLSVFDRYERRALSRRKFCIREFDLARLSDQKKSDIA
jgi:uncharacterized small protein (DUF1192 family)